MMAAPPALPGETFAGKYRIERVLGQGGMGVVVLARHLDLDERVAIKFLVKTGDTGAVERFVREARAAAKVKSEHVCRVYDVGRLPTGEPYIVMEYLEGIDLAKKLEQEGPQPIHLVALWMVEVCEALAGAHAAGIIHRDLKPANILLAERTDGSTCAKVLDFGVSKLPTQTFMTNAAANMGTPLYMSPEQIASASDVDAICSGDI
jgi:eukaryotic-like serine/threonine-protein kinase